MKLGLSLLLCLLLCSSLALGVTVTDFEVYELGDDGFVVGWQTDEPATSQLLYGATGRLGGSTSVDSISKTDHQMQISGLNDNTVYFFRATGRNSAGEQYYSVIGVTRTTPQESNSFQIVSVEHYDITETSFRVRWELHEGATGQIFIGASENPTNGLFLEQQLQTTHDMRVSQLSPGSVQYYKVTGKNSDGTSYESDVFRVELIDSSDTVILPPNDPPTDSPNDSPSGDVGGELKAFPSAYGAGAYASGGRGGRVIHVTNLNDAGPGSFRAAVEASGPRIVVFDVSGTIELQSGLAIVNGDLTIAGQTAPEGGITITKDQVTFSLGTSSWITENIIMRHIRVRPTTNGWGRYDALETYRLQNSIIDHVSFSWGADEAFSVVFPDTDKITISNNIMAESKTGTLFGANTDSKTTDQLSLHRNIYYGISHRFPNPNTDGRLDIINNLIFNHKAGLSQITESPKMNYINNYHSLGCLDSIEGVGHKMSDRSSAQIYTSGNYVNKRELTSPTADNWLLFQWWEYVTGRPDEEVIPRTYQRTTMWPLVGAQLPILSATDAYDELTQSAGASKRLDANGNVLENHDVVDQLYLSNIRKGDCVAYQSSSSGANYDLTSHYRNFHTSVSTTPIARHPSNYDNDRDGMPDAWERNNGMVVGVDDSAQDYDGDGYTNIEEFINLVDIG